MANPVHVTVPPYDGTVALYAPRWLWRRFFHGTYLTVATCRLAPGGPVRVEFKTRDEDEAIAAADAMQVCMATRRSPAEWRAEA